MRKEKVAIGLRLGVEGLGCGWELGLGLDIESVKVRVEEN